MLVDICTGKVVMPCSKNVINFSMSCVNFYLFIFLNCKNKNYV